MDGFEELNLDQPLDIEEVAELGKDLTMDQELHRLEDLIIEFKQETTDLNRLVEIHEEI